MNYLDKLLGGAVFLLVGTALLTIYRPWSSLPFLISALWLFVSAINDPNRPKHG